MGNVDFIEDLERSHVLDGDSCSSCMRTLGHTVNENRMHSLSNLINILFPTKHRHQMLKLTNFYENLMEY